MRSPDFRRHGDGGDGFTPEASPPAAPPAPLRGFMGVVTDDLLAYAAERGEGGEMVSGLLDTWTRGWR